jgi:hypothetical protein
MAKRTMPGVFCLEGSWSSKLTDRSSVRPLLELLEEQRIIRYAHRDTGTIEEFEHYLKQWSQAQYSNYGLAYLAQHGEPGAIQFGRKVKTLEEIADLLEGRLKGRTIYFASCEVLNIKRDEAEHFRQRTKARAICGYTESVDWIESAAFEMNVIEAASRFKRIDAGFNYLQRVHKGACRAMGFRATWDGDCWW